MCVLLCTVALPAAVHGADAPERHVRAVDATMVAAIRDGEARSVLFRTLVAALDESDVVVHISYHDALPPGVSAHVAFAGAGGGRRYLHVGILRTLEPDRQIAMLGHELFHALEIAGAPDVVDAATLAQFYARIGYLVEGRGCTRYDSAPARDVGPFIERELRARRPKHSTE